MSYGVEILSPDGYSYVLAGYSCFKFVTKLNLSLSIGSGISSDSKSVALGSDKYLIFIRYLEGPPTRVTGSVSGNILTVTSNYGVGQSVGTRLSCDVYVFCDYTTGAKDSYGIEVYDENGRIVFDNNTKSLSINLATKAMLPITGGRFAATYTPFRSGQIGVHGQGWPIIGDVVPWATGDKIDNGQYIHTMPSIPISVVSNDYSGYFAYIDTTIYD